MQTRLTWLSLAHQVEHRRAAAISNVVSLPDLPPDSMSFLPSPP
jgi:hypothetical protein